MSRRVETRRIDGRGEDRAAPAVSLCVPTFNGERYLEECLRSVLAQTEADLEVLIVDDGSTDATPRMACEAAADDDRIRVYRNERNLGLVGNWNRCVELARGEWIKFVFQDDLVAPRCVAALRAAAGERFDLAACMRDFEFEAGIDPGTERYYRTHPTLDSVFGGVGAVDAATFQAAVLEHLGFNFVGEPTAVLFRREAWLRTGPFNADLVAICDFEFWARIGVHSGLAAVSEPLATFRVHAGAESARNNAERFYRMTELDQVVLMHEYAFQPVFAPLREAARRAGVRLDARCAMRAARARSLSRSDPALQAQYAHIAALYPAIERAPNVISRVKGWFG
jgi:glycosyltransferase involved in cell wall biosynthesis